MKIVFTGNYAADYNRTALLIEGLRTMPSIILIEYPISDTKKSNIPELESVLDSADIVFLPSFTHTSVRFIRKHTTKPICFDPLISKYLTKVFDYKLVWKYSPRALKNFYKDKRAFTACDVMLADTEAHKTYYVETFSIPESKIFVLPVGVNTNHFSPHIQANVEKSKITVGFYGGFIPLQGVSHILDAAHILAPHPEIQFCLVGNGFEFAAMQKKAETLSLSNVKFMGWQPYSELPSIINSWDICLGIFGDTKKADLVIPNKLYHYAAMQKPIITKQSGAIQELFTHNQSVLLCSTKPQDIAAHILELVENQEKREFIAKHALAVAQQYKHTHIAAQFVAILQRVLHQL